MPSILQTFGSAGAGRREVALTTNILPRWGRETNAQHPTNIRLRWSRQSVVALTINILPRWGRETNAQHPTNIRLRWSRSERGGSHYKHTAPLGQGDECPAP